MVRRRWVLQVRALETTDGHDQTEFNRILHGIYVVGQPGRAMPQQTGWPYLPTALDTVRGGERATNPAHDLDPRRGTQQSAVSKRLLQVSACCLFVPHALKLGVGLAYPDSALPPRAFSAST
jgi:hypothetical protein